MASRNLWSWSGLTSTAQACRIGIAVSMLALAAGAVHAYVPSEAVGKLYEKRLQLFVGATGFAAQPDDKLERALPERACRGCPEDRGLQMLTWPLMRIDAAEGYLPSARYFAKVWYVPIADPSTEEQMMLTLVEVSRYNHGARISAELRHDYGEDARGPLKTDAAPNVQWRFGVMRIPQTNEFTDVMSPSRRVLSARDAALSQCLGSTCLTLAYDGDGEPIPPLPGGTWGEMGSTTDVLATKSLFARHRKQQAGKDGPGQLLDIDAIAEALQHASSVVVDGEGRGTASDKPDVVMQIDYLIDGQDAVTTGIVCWLDAADDAIKDSCMRIRAVGDGEPEWHQYLVPQKRGR